MAVLAVAAAGWSLPAQAAPVSGSATLEIVFVPQEGGAFKIDLIDVKLEADLVLTLSVSGVDITSTSVFTFKGMEFQSFTFTGTVGALAFRSVIIFAPNIVEIEIVRDQYGRARYCINLQDPDTASPSDDLFDNAYDCPYSGSALIGLIEGGGVLENLILAAEFDRRGHLDPALTFRKKIAELSLSLAGLTIGLRGMFANIGSAQTPKWRMGVVASVEGQTVSGITIRGETWIGALQGLECFGECKPLEVIRGGKIYDDGDDVEDDFVITEEKLFIRNLKIAGVTFGARIEFAFVGPSVGLTFLQLTQDFTLAPFGLSINNVMNVQGPDLTIVADTITTNLKIGDMAMVASFIIRPAATGAFNIYFAQLITTFDAPGMKVTDVLLPCLDEVNCGGVSILDHQLNLSTTVGDVSFDVTLYFADLFRGFYQADVIVGWKIGNTTITSTTIVGENALLGQKFSFGFTF
jgi:hypothetical protein